MILADTNIFIDFWNNPSDDISKVFESEDVVICGIVRAELLHGALSEKDYARITTMLEAFDEKVMEPTDWQLLGSNLYKLRRSGLTVPLSDAIIATLAIKYDVPVWTKDRHFPLIGNVLSGLRIYQVSI